MAEKMLSNRPDYGRTFHTAMWLAGLIASIQLLAIVWAVFIGSGGASGSITRVGGPDAIAANGASPTAVVPIEERRIGAVKLPPIPAEIAAAIEQQKLEPQLLNSPLRGVRRELPVNMGGSGPINNEAASSSERFTPSLSEALANAKYTAERIEDPILERLVSTGEELRVEGNMVGAIQALRRAEEALPDHPRVLAEMAATLSQMRQDRKADFYWQKLIEMSPTRARDYSIIAQQQLAGGFSAPTESVGQIMSIGEIEVDESSPVAEGQRVSLRIVIDSKPELNPVGDQLSLLVYFYDRIDGERIDASTADTSYLYPTEPYDWQTNGREEIIVNYDQPVFTELQKREQGERRYYGYAIELYYRDQLQDRVTRPEDISRVTIEQGAADSDVAPETFGPENSLFPDKPIF
ncbi:MAG: hypothetical protein CMO61_13470 [Verrucomicrobiales bacterium]|nr:hypothetical protein [Verrucomicrobiales bacterium]